jgi:hypothetical protein
MLVELRADILYKTIENFIILSLCIDCPFAVSYAEYFKIGIVLLP